MSKSTKRLILAIILTTPLALISVASTSVDHFTLPPLSDFVSIMSDDARALGIVGNVVGCKADCTVMVPPVVARAFSEDSTWEKPFARLRIRRNSM